MLTGPVLMSHRDVFVEKGVCQIVLLRFQEEKLSIFRLLYLFFWPRLILRRQIPTQSGGSASRDRFVRLLRASSSLQEIDAEECSTQILIPLEEILFEWRRMNKDALRER